MEELVFRNQTSMPEYGVWATMRNRCNNQNVPSYPSYGGRGIKVCPEWDRPHGFMAFITDMGRRPEGYEIERLDNDGPYAPGNCVWAPRRIQVKNKRNNRHISALGKTLTLIEWARELGCSPAAILNRIKRGMAEADAVTMPPATRPNSKLTDQQALSIKSCSDESQAKLAKEFGVDAKSIANIRNGVTFADL